jgi:hypothetical protein
MYLEIDEGFPKHRKTLRLRSIMRDPLAGWYMVDLWTWACRSCPDGDLTGISSYEIEEAANYSPRDGKLCQAMIDSGFIDTDGNGNPVGLHNWMERTGAAIARMAKRASDMKVLREQRRRERDGTVTAQLHHGDATNPTRPVQSSQDQSRPVQSSDQKENSCANQEPAPLALELIPSSKKQRTQRAYTQAFETAWKGYVRGEGKAEAFAEWLKIAPSAGGEEALLVLVQRAMEWQRPKLARDGGRYAVHFCRWLKHRRWEDEPANGSSSGGGLTPEQIANGSWRTQCKPAS